MASTSVHGTFGAVFLEQLRAAARSVLAANDSQFAWWARANREPPDFAFGRVGIAVPVGRTKPTSDRRICSYFPIYVKQFGYIGYN